MGDMADTYKALRQHQKERRKNNETYWKNKMENVGAKFLTEGVYRLGDFDIYPARGYARNYKTNKRTSIERVIGRKE
jgi:hypothetical protein